MHTIPHKSQSQDISAPVIPPSDLTPTFEGEEYEVEIILNHRKRGTGSQFLTLMKGFPSNDPEWQSTKDFIHADGTINEKFLEYGKSKNISRNLWTTDFVVDNNREEVGIV